MSSEKYDLYSLVDSNGTIEIRLKDPSPPRPPATGGEIYTPPLAVTSETVGGSTATVTQIAPFVTAKTAEAWVSPAVVNALLDKAAKTGGIGRRDRIEVRITASSSATWLEVTLPRASFARIAQDTDADFGIVSPEISITFDPLAMESIARAAESGNVVISAGVVDLQTLSAENRAKAEGRPVYDLSVRTEGKPVSYFGGGCATVSIPYTLRPGENPDSVVVYYLADDGSLHTVRCRYNAKTGAVVFKTTHFSQFVVGHNRVSFRDVAADAWYQKAVGFIAARGITGGTGDHQFDPNINLTRGQFMVLLMKAYQISPDRREGFDSIVPFDDAENTYYTAYLHVAKGLGIANGVGGNRFAPDRDLTRQEMFVMLYNVLESIGELSASGSGAGLEAFSDFDQTAPWAHDALTVFVKGGIISGSGSKLNLTGITTRAEMAQVLYNLLSK